MAVSHRQVARDATILRVLSIFTGLLLICTWRLWVGQHVFPQVPLFGWAVDAPRWIDNLSAIVLLGSIAVVIGLAGSTSLRRSSVGVAITALMILWSLDQHRFQPWAYHFALAAWILVALPATHNLRWLRLLTVSVYLFCRGSANSTPGFLRRMGRCSWIRRGRC